MNPYVFIAGCPRSGMTLLRHIVGAHPQIAITPEAHWIPLWFEQRRGLTPDGDVTCDLIPELLAHPKFALFRLRQEELASVLRTSQPCEPCSPMSQEVFVLTDRLESARSDEGNAALSGNL